MIIEFYDNDDTYGRIETDVSREKIEKILDKYRKENPDEYNINDFFIILKEKIKFTELQLNADGSIYF